jgi:hypothetical protein
LLLDAPFLVAPFFLSNATYDSSLGVIYSSIYCLKLHPGGFDGGRKSSTRIPYKKITWLMMALIIATVNVKTETTFLGCSSSQSQLNGEVGNEQAQYLMSYIS